MKTAAEQPAYLLPQTHNTRTGSKAWCMHENTVEHQLMENCKFQASI